jgi:hypothetical protein
LQTVLGVQRFERTVRDVSAEPSCGAPHPEGLKPVVPDEVGRAERGAVATNRSASDTDARV